MTGPDLGGERPEQRSRAEDLIGCHEKPGLADPIKKERPD